MERDFREFLELLEENRVEYLLVGGHAIIAYTEPRYTGDIDVWIKLSEANAEKVVTVIKEFGFSSLGFTKEDFLVKQNVIQMGKPPVRIDIMMDISGVIFEDCYTRKVIRNEGGLSLPYISPEDLLINKIASGRDKDLLDAKNLKKTLAKKSKQ